LHEYLPEEVLTSMSNLDLSLSSRNLPAKILEQVETLLLNGGKKVRPGLCYMMGGVFGIKADKLHPYARATELVHLASIAHDDVIDQSIKRRNRKTLNSATSNTEAVLVGDVLLARVMMEISALGNVRMIQDLSSTVEDLVGGELLQVQNRFRLDITREELEEASRRKTGSLMGWCCQISGRLVSDEDRIPTLCRRLGESIGIAFQMVDDILDFEVKGEKPYAQDLKEGLVNFVAYELIQINPEIRMKLKDVLGKNDIPDRIWNLIWKPEELALAKKNVRTQARAKLITAHQSLQEIIQIFSRVSRVDERYVRAFDQVFGFLGERVV
jgi:geranylgeranyl pyrophosphate synthase